MLLHTHLADVPLLHVLLAGGPQQPGQSNKGEASRRTRSLCENSFSYNCDDLIPDLVHHVSDHPLDLRVFFTASEDNTPPNCNDVSRHLSPTRSNKYSSG